VVLTIINMTKIKIVYDRKNCISVGSCALLAERFWKMNQEDGKADLIGSRPKEGEDDVWEREIEDDDLEENKEAARNCPVAVIKIFDKSGKEMKLHPF